MSKLPAEVSHTFSASLTTSNGDTIEFVEDDIFDFREMLATTLETEEIDSGVIASNIAVFNQAGSVEVIPVAIFSTDEFDATNIDPTSLDVSVETNIDFGASTTSEFDLL